MSTDWEQGQQVLDMANDALFDKNKKRALETASPILNGTDHQTVVPSAYGAKVLNHLDTLVKEYENSSYTKEKTFIREVADALGIPREKFKDTSSQYATFETKNGKIVTIRISNHNATASNLDINGQEDAISIVVTNKRNNGITNGGDAHIVEYYYNAIKLRKAEGKPLAEIVRSIRQALYSGEFKDTTGLAERQEVNADVQHGNGVRFFRTSSGEVYGFTVGGKIYIDPRIATSETPIHEYAHLWAEALRKANPKEWQNVVKLMKECKTVWEQVKKEYPELKTDDEIADEVLAHYSGQRGAERLRAEADKATNAAKGMIAKAEVINVFNKLREAIKRVWKHIAEDILHIHFTSAEEVADKVMYDLLRGFAPRKVKGENGEVTSSEDYVRLSRVTDRREVDRLEHEPKIKTYRAMQVVDGKLYPPMAAKVGDKMVEPTKLGQWEKADEHPELVDKSGKFVLDKGTKDANGKSQTKVAAAYNPYIHSSLTPLNDQFATAYKRPNLVTVEMEVPESELTSGYHAEGAKDAVGMHRWKAGEVQRVLTGMREVMLSRWAKPVRIVPDAEVARIIKRQVGDMPIPENTVTPSLKAELEKAGVKVVPLEEFRRLYPSKSKKASTAVRQQASIEQVNARFNEELEEQIDGMQEPGHVYKLGMPSSILLSTGIPDLPIQLSATRLKEKATNFGHDYALKDVKDLVKALQHPLAIFAYGNKEKAQNVVVELEKNGKNFIVGLSLRPVVNGRVLEINSIRNVFPKNNSEWLNWIVQDKALYIDKKKVQDLIDKQRTILADVDYLDLNSVAKIVEDFENPVIKGENFSGEEENNSMKDAPTTPAEAEDVAKQVKLKEGNYGEMAAGGDGARGYTTTGVDFSAGGRAGRASVEQAVADVDKLTGGDTAVIDSSEVPDDVVKKLGEGVKGYMKGGKAYVVANNCDSAAEAATVAVHESAGSKIFPNIWPSINSCWRLSGFSSAFCCLR